MSFIDSASDTSGIGFEGSGFPRAGSADANSLGGGGTPSVLGMSPLQLGGLAAGGAGLGYMLSRGQQPLPQQFQDVTGSVPGLRAEGQLLERQGSTLTNQGTEALRMAQAGQLTDPQKAQLQQFQTGLTNQSRQMFANMGRNPDQDTAFINQTANNDAQVNAMAQQEIQSTIALGLGELSSGASFSGAGLGFENAANNALIQAGEAQLKQDQAYSKSLTDTFATIGKLFGTIAGGAFGGPGGAAVGGAAGGAIGGAVEQ